VFAQAAHFNGRVVKTPVDPFSGKGLEGISGVELERVVNDHTGPGVEFPQVFLATTFQ
jgi:hypothetical protein